MKFQNSDLEYKFYTKKYPLLPVFMHFPDQKDQNYLFRIIILLYSQYSNKYWKIILGFHFIGRKPIFLSLPPYSCVV